MCATRTKLRSSCTAVARETNLLIWPRSSCRMRYTETKLIGALNQSLG